VRGALQRMYHTTVVVRLRSSRSALRQNWPI
jgi:hypothetical protein